MDVTKIEIPELPEIVVKGIVAVRSAELNRIVDAYNTLASTVVSQQNIIQTLAKEVSSCRDDIYKIAKILEELYET